MADIFSLLDLQPFVGKTVYIVGAGPKGAEFVDSIPEDAITIALNGAIRYNKTFTFWLVNDHRLVDYDWMQDFLPPASTLVVFGHSLATYIRAYHPRIVPSYTFQFRPALQEPYNTDFMMHGILRGGASIAGCACQMAAFGGSTLHVWCGLDMQGNGHFDGFVNTRMHHSAVWNDCRHLSAVRHLLRLHWGVQTYTLSPTAVENVRQVTQEELNVCD
jgi:hypothetical protein